MKQEGKGDWSGKKRDMKFVRIKQGKFFIYKSIQDENHEDFIL